MTPIIIFPPRIRHAQQTPPIELQPAVKLVFERRAIVEAALAAGPGTRGIAALDDKSGYKPMEDSIVVVAVEAELQKVARGERRLLCEELESYIAGCGVQNDFSGRLWLESLKAAHFRRFLSFLVSCLAGCGGGEMRWKSLGT